jgi:hypothetical protein
VKTAIGLRSGQLQRHDIWRMRARHRCIDIKCIIVRAKYAVNRCPFYGASKSVRVDASLLKEIVSNYLGPGIHFNYDCARLERFAVL